VTTCSNPADDPHANLQFLVFSAGDPRPSTCTPTCCAAPSPRRRTTIGSGANEAPPAIISIFLGEQLQDVLKQVERRIGFKRTKKGGKIDLGARTLPVLPHGLPPTATAPRPFAFTGNKFEFRAVGSSAPIYWPQTVLNTLVADSMEQLADELEKLKPNDMAGLSKILASIIKDHKQVLFSGNGYSDEWHAEAAKRGLPNNKSTVDALPALETEKAKKLFSKHGVLSERELGARAEINWERYVKVQNIEANTALDMAKTMILPATVKYLGELTGAGKSKGIAKIADQVSALADKLVDGIEALEKAHHAAHEAGSLHAEAKVYKEKVIPAQDALRDAADALEALVSDELWPLPKYRELLFQY
jgi:glutamine synthetase